MKRTISQKARFWTWRSFCTIGRVMQLGIIAFTLFIGVLAAGEVVHKPIIADRVQAQHIMPAAHAK